MTATYGASAAEHHRPAGELAVARLEHPRVHVADQVGLLGDRQELVGREQSGAGPFPPDERLVALHLAGVGADDRLVVQDQLVIGRSRPAAACSSTSGVGRPRGAWRVVDVGAAPPARLRDVRRRVGLVDQRRGVGAAAGREGDADARPDAG